jgi:hypothetical protein
MPSPRPSRPSRRSSLPSLTPPARRPTPHTLVFLAHTSRSSSSSSSARPNPSSIPSTCLHLATRLRRPHTSTACRGPGSFEDHTSSTRTSFTSHSGPRPSPCPLRPACPSMLSSTSTSSTSTAWTRKGTLPHLPQGCSNASGTSCPRPSGTCESRLSRSSVSDVPLSASRPCSTRIDVYHQAEASRRTLHLWLITDRWNDTHKCFNYGIGFERSVWELINKSPSWPPPLEQAGPSRRSRPRSASPPATRFVRQRHEDGPERSLAPSLLASSRPFEMPSTPPPTVPPPKHAQLRRSPSSPVVALEPSPVPSATLAPHSIGLGL